MATQIDVKQTSHQFRFAAVAEREVPVGAAEVVAGTAKTQVLHRYHVSGERGVFQPRHGLALGVYHVRAELGGAGGGGDSPSAACLSSMMSCPQNTTSETDGKPL